MQRHAVQYEDNGTAPLVSDAVFRLPQSDGSFQTGGPVISRVSRIKTATVIITTTDTSQTTAPSTVRSLSLSLSPMDTPTVTASPIVSATSASMITTPTAPSTKEFTPQPTSTDTDFVAAQVSVPVNTLIAIVAGTIGGLLLLVFFIAVAQAFVRRRRIINEESQSPGGPNSTLEKGGLPDGQRQHRVNDGNIGIPHPSPSAHSGPGISRQYQAAYIVPDAVIHTWAAAHDLHPRQVIAELPAESDAGHSQHDHRG